MSLLGKTSSLPGRLEIALRRFPFAVLAASLVTGVLLALVFGKVQRERYVGIRLDDLPLGLVVAFFTAVSAAFAASGRSARGRVLAEGAGFLIGLSLLFTVAFNDHTVVPLLVALVCLMSVTAGIAARNGTRGFWFANAHLLASLAIGLLALGVVLAGGAVVLFTIDTLLGWPVEKLGFALGIVAVFLAFPLLWLTLVGPVTTGAITGDADPGVLRVVPGLTDALLVPLTLVFGIVLHVYAGRIAVTGEWPKGQIGTIVPLYLALGYGTLLLASGPHAAWARVRSLFRRAWLASTVIPLGLLAGAVALRVAAYGLTEQRYWLILASVGAGFLAASVLVRRPFDIRLVPLTGGVLMIVGAFGPLSAVTMVAWSAADPTEVARGASDASVQTSSRPSPAPEGFLFTIPEIVRVGTVTILNDVALDFDLHKSHVIRSAAARVTLSLDGRFLAIEGETWTTRFDLSPLLTMDRKGLEDLQPTLSSAEGRQAAFLLSQFQRVMEPSGPAIRYLSGTIIVY